MDTDTILRTVLVVLVMFGLPLLALVGSWRRKTTATAGEEAAPRPGWAATGFGHRAPRHL
jgi:hypothetical protein